MILLDTSVLLDCFTGPRRLAPALARAIQEGERVVVLALVLYEWLRGPRKHEELADLEALFPRAQTVAFGAEDAARAAVLYREVRSSRGREVDLAIAACVLRLEGRLWTLNVDDFRDIPGLVVERPA